MATKKERGRFSLRFNIGDPVQRAAVELLELQPPRSKSQYIANAITYYNTNFADDPHPVKVAPPVLDRATIESIVREIMRQETQQADQPPTSLDSSQKAKIDLPTPEESEKPNDKLARDEKMEVDETTRDMILSTMAAFHRGR